MARILYLDPDCPTPYNPKRLEEGALGGTEATIVRIAEGLARRGHTVVVAQGARTDTEYTISGVRYQQLHWQQLAIETFDTIVLLNTPKLLKQVRKHWPGVALYLWIHCFPGKRRRKMLNKLAVNADATLLAVSETLKNTLEQHLAQYPTYGSKNNQTDIFAKVQRVYNPVDEQLVADNTPIDQNKLVFFSSPHKGLAQVLMAFKEVKKLLPQMKLYIAHPGYMPLPAGLEEEDVVVLGALSHKEVLWHVREALAVFYPQNTFKETFGLVFAEANAVGTPVLSHPLGAAEEVLENKQQLVDVSNKQTVAQTIQAWRNKQRPQVSLPAKFRIKQVLNRWEELVGTIEPNRMPAEHPVYQTTRLHEAKKRYR